MHAIMQNRNQLSRWLFEKSININEWHIITKVKNNMFKETLSRSFEYVSNEINSATMKN